MEQRQWLQTYTGHSEYVYSTAFSRDSQLIASLACARATDESSCPNTEVHIWEALTGELKQRIRAGIPSEPYSIEFSPTDNSLAVGYQNGMIVLWGDWTTPAISQTLTGPGGHSAWVNSLAFSPDGQTLASSSDDQTIQFWNVETGRPQLDPSLRAHTDWVWSVAFSPNGQAMASGGEDQSVVLWNLEGNRLDAERLPGHNGPITGLVVEGAVGGQPRLLSAASDGLRLWDLNAQPATFDTFQATVPVNVPFDGKSLVFTPDGRQIVAGGQDGAINVWDAETLRSVGDPIIAHSGTVWALAFSPDGVTLASGSDGDNEVHLWDFATRTPITPLVGDATGIYSLAFSPDGKVIAGGTLDARIFIWEVQSRRLLQTLPAGVGYVASLSFSPDGRWLAAGGDPISGASENLYLWHTEGYRRHGTLTGHPGWVGAVAFHPDASNPLFVSGGDDGTIRLWDPATLRLRGQLNVESGSAVRSLAFSPDGARLISGTFDGSIQVWDVASRSLLSVLAGHDNIVWAVDFRPDGQALASVSADQTIRVWDPASSTEIGILESVQNQGVHQIAELALSEDGSRLATSGAEGALVMWDLREDSLPRQVLGYSETNAASLAFTQDGQSLTALYGAFDDTIQTFRASEVQIWDLTGSAPVSRTLSVGAITITAQSLAVHPFTGLMAVGLDDGSIAHIELSAGEVVTIERTIHQNAVTALTYSPDGIWLASGDASGEVIVQNTETGVRRPLSGHTTEVHSLAFGRFGGAWVLASSSASHIAMWDVLKRQLIAEFPYERVEHLAFTPNGETLLAGDADGSISMLSVGLEASEARACSLSGRNLTWQEWKSYISESGRPYPVVCSQNPVDYANLALGALADARTDARLGNRDQARAGLSLAVENAQKVEVISFELARSVCVGVGPDFKDVVRPV
ncbi:MAG: WD40 repeat domain-containing protein, partial [Anaerolineales bacterium]